MKKADFQLIGYIGIVLGVIFIIGAILTQMPVYQETILGGYWVTYPYAKYTITFLVIGVILLVIGIAFYWRAKQEEVEKAKPPKPPKRFGV